MFNERRMYLKRVNKQLLDPSKLTSEDVNYDDCCLADFSDSYYTIVDKIVAHRHNCRVVSVQSIQTFEDAIRILQDGNPGANHMHHIPAKTRMQIKTILLSKGFLLDDNDD